MKSKILFSGYALAFCFIVSGVAFAQVSSSDTSIAAKNSLKPDTWALEFGITSHFALTSFQGTVLSLKRQLNNHEAIQLGVGVSYNDQTNAGSSTTDQSDTLSITSPYTGFARTASIQFNVQYLYYVNPDADVNLYLGSGPTFGFGWNSGENNNPFPSGYPDYYYVSSSHSSVTQTSWNLGVTCMAGVECFVLRYLSLHAQYGLTIGYFVSDRTEASTLDYTLVGQPATSLVSRMSSESKSHGWSIYGSSVLFGLSVYF